MKHFTIKEYSKHINQEFSSEIITRHRKINLKEINLTDSNNTNGKKLEK